MNQPGHLPCPNSIWKLPTNVSSVSCLCCWSHVLLPVEMHCSWSRAGIPPESLQVRRSLLGSQHIQCPGRESLSSLPSALEGRWCAASMWNSGSHPGSHRSSLGCICTQCPSSWSTPARSAGPCLPPETRPWEHQHGIWGSTLPPVVPVYPGPILHSFTCQRLPTTCTCGTRFVL